MALGNLPSSRRPEDPTKAIRGYVSAMVSSHLYLVSAYDAHCSAFHPSCGEPWGLKDIIILSEAGANALFHLHDGSPTTPGPVIAKFYSLANNEKMWSFIGTLPIVSGLVVHSVISGISITVVGRKR